jgi:adenine-specific DNA-methyltransferase
VENKKHKTLGQVYTPIWIVNEILDLLKYDNEDILEKYILEPSCGDGVFLEEIVKRYINIAIKKKLNTHIIIKYLEKYVYGIEIDDIECEKTIIKLNQLINLTLGNDIQVNWNIINSNTFHFYKNFPYFFDFIVGNPPYVRIHNIDLETKTILKNEFIFTEGSMDIYLSFFEMSLNMLKTNGKIGFITSNSYLHNNSYKKFRNYLKENKLVELIIDFKANKLFENFSTYTAITILSKNNKNSFIYKEMINGKIEIVNTIDYINLNSNDWSFSNDSNTAFISSLTVDKNGTISDFFNVQYGFATLRDKIFIGKIKEHDVNLVFFNDHLIEKKILKKIVKASKFRGNINDTDYVIFPYFLDSNRYKPFSETELMENFPLAYKYLLINKEELLKRDIDKGVQWFEFGRSQGIQSMNNEKIVVSTMMNDEIKYYKLPADIFIYSGIFIIKNKSYSEWDMIEKILSSDDFCKFIKITAKDLSGGYKSVTTKHIKEFKINTL